VQYEAVDDTEALAAVKECCECEGILPAIESAHALAAQSAGRRPTPVRGW